LPIEDWIGALFSRLPGAPVDLGELSTCIESYARLVEHQIAQVNVGRLVAPRDSAQLAGFFAALDPVNAAADRAPGFV